MSRLIPEINHKPLVGNLLEVRRDRLGLFRRLSRTRGDIGGYYMGCEKYSRRAVRDVVRMTVSHRIPPRINEREERLHDAPVSAGASRCPFSWAVLADRQPEFHAS